MSRPARLAVEDGPEVLHGIFEVSRETVERLTTYVNLLLHWQKAQNLVAPSTLPEAWRRHVADSLQVVAMAPDAARWADLGSGAGFPGLVTAMVQMERLPGAHVHLIESNSRKAAFLRTVIRETGCPATVHASRIEDVSGELAGEIDAVSARALADLSELLAYTEPFQNHGAPAIFHKGKNFRDEVARAAHAWEFDLVERESLIDPDSRLLMISGLRPRGATGKGQTG
ncbi:MULTISPECIES: 16S rRNA (guanine(527)-N(7))-methyltransferase RsmG [Stappia]|jgi:16S rRNA (guanine527-N7)-methyltransferase|uniref:Ribosomal RNA small subunit methyltransferase G n=1 Tax=Stappia indica TaxID=538381 RepID=A0A285S0N7_9HYPH|nr:MULTISPECIES: 16S rRNA (guanine(527)-N(7))-methyltransferase RsmG [Stappia]MBC2861553.1 16S rRNA (guanine(527)-N(7))-methyltransferase RsmG [Stappia sp. 28M-7]SOC00383.1 16S rRNA (guanine527-N7)-methyltransferase [Stappia indica]